MGLNLYRLLINGRTKVLFTRLLNKWTEPRKLQHLCLERYCILERRNMEEEYVEGMCEHLICICMCVCVCVCVLVSVCMSASVCVFITRNITVFCSRHLYWYDNHFQRALNSSFGYSGYIKSANSRFLANSSKCRILVREQLSLWYLRLEHLIAIVIVRTIMIMKLWWESNKLCLIIINVFHGSHPLGTYYSSTW